MDRRTLLAGFLASAASPVLAAPPLVSARPVVRPENVIAQARSLGPERLIARAGISGRVSCAVADLQSGKITQSVAPLLPMPPASVAKSLTALYALDALGAGYRFETRVGIAGSVSGGRLDGDLVLIGSGDPTLDTDALAALAAQVRAAGIQEVTGQLLIWSGALPTFSEIDPSQPEHVGYNPAISGTNLNFNRVYFEWKAQGAAGAYSTTMDARSERHRPALDGIRMRVANRNLPVYTHQLRQGREEWSVARTALGKGGGRWLPVRQPALYCAEVMAVLLAAQGVRLRGIRVVASPPRTQVLAVHQSASLSEIVRDMLRFSTNLTAEVIGLIANQARGAMPSSLRASAGTMNRWISETTPAQRPRLRDHSGLSAESEISATDMVRALVARRSHQMLFDHLKEISPSEAALEAGAPPGLEIRAKTGTLNYVSALAGYFQAPGRGTQAFAIFCADLPRRARLTQAQQDAPPGGRAWRSSARALQMALIAEWSKPGG